MAGSRAVVVGPDPVLGLVAEPGARLEGEAGVRHLLADASHRGQGRFRLDADPVDQPAGAQVVQRGAVAGDDRRMRAGQVLDHVQPAHRPSGGEQHRDAGGLRGEHGRGVLALTVPSGERKVPSRSVAISAGTLDRTRHYSREPGVVGGAGERCRTRWAGHRPDSVPDGDGEPDPDADGEGIRR